jgi:hypothetical protein
MKIILTVAHSGLTFTDGFGQSVGGKEYLPLYKGILAGYNDNDPLLPPLYDFIAPQMYTCNVGTTCEYAANDAVSWFNTNDPNYDDTKSFRSEIFQNPQFLKYGLNFISPAVNFANFGDNAKYFDCYDHGGTNYEVDVDGNYSRPSPNSAFYYYLANYKDQSGTAEDKSRNPFPTYFGIGHVEIDVLMPKEQGDLGVKKFYQNLINYKDDNNTGDNPFPNNLGGGCMHWVNGDISPTPMITLPPVPTSVPNI